MKIFSIKRLIIATLFIGIFGLVFYNTKDLLFGAKLSVHTVLDGSTVSDNFLPIYGNARHSTVLEINGRVIATTKSGDFSDGVVLSPGYNIIEIAQKDRFGKESKKIYQLVAQPSESVATLTNIHY